MKTLFRTIFCSTTILLLFLLAVVEVSAQDNTLRQANEAFNRFEYRNAIDLYIAVLKKERNNPIALENIAECYRLTGDTRRAESAFKKAASANPSKTLLFFRYGQMLMANQKYEEAQKVFEHYKKLEPTDNRGYVFAESCKNIHVLRRDSSGYQIKTLPFNTNYSEFSPTLYENGVVFASSRPGSLLEQKDGWTGEAYLDLYYTQKKDDKWSEPVVMPGKPSISAHEGPAVFNRYGTLMYFTRSATKAEMKKTGTATLKIFQAKRGSTGWTDIEALPFNREGYSMGQPALSPDGKTLYFIADLPGGMGGKDLYMSKLVNGKWTEPQNMGESINTRGDEMFPTVQSDGTLYYSSDGLGGLGGLDIYRVNIAANGGYMVENVGYPINSSKDDFGLIYLADYRTAYLSSNRYNGRGDDILEVAISPLRAGKLVKEQPLLIIDDFGTGSQADEVPAKEVRQNESVTLPTDDTYKEEKVIDAPSSNDNLPDISDGKAVSIAIKGRLLDKTTTLPINNQKVELLDQTSGQNYQFTTKYDGSFTFIVPKNNVHKLRSFKPNGEEAQALSLNFINTSINDMPAEIVLLGELPVVQQVIEEYHESVPQPLTHLGKGGIYGTDMAIETANNTPVAVPNPDNLPINIFTFKVQVSAFKSHKSKINYSFFNKLPIPYVKETTDAIRFTSGSFTTLAEAEAYCNQLRAIPSYNDAFVVVYINGKRSSKKLDELVQEYNLRSVEPNR